MSAYEAPLRLWTMIEEHLDERERMAVMDALGEAQVLESLELHQEVETLLDIWREVREGVPEDEHVSSCLPEPPQVRELVTREIQYFVSNLRERVDDEHHMDAVLSAVDKRVLHYACPELAARLSPSRPQSALSREGRETPLVPSDRSRGSSSASSLSEVDSMRDKINFLTIDDVLVHLRRILRHEVECLHRDIDFLQDCLENEVHYRHDAPSSKQPSLTALREARAKLEKEVFSFQGAMQSLPRKAPSPLAKKPSTAAQRLKSSPDSALAPLVQTPPMPSPPAQSERAARSGLNRARIRVSKEPVATLRATHAVSSTRISSAERLRKLVKDCRLNHDATHS